MSNSVIYIVVASGGQYDDSWESNLVTTFDKKVAEKYIADEPARQELWEKHGTKFHEMMEGWNESYQKKNPAPVWEGPQSNELFSAWAEVKDPLYKVYEKRIAESFGLDLALDYYGTEEKIFLRIEEVPIL
jgi:hypothetical protein